MANIIKIKNTSSARVVISVPHLHLRRPIPAGATMPFSEEEYQYLQFEPGFNTLITGHYIKILNPPELDGISTVEDVGTVYEAPEIKAMLQKRDITTFAKFIKDATDAERAAVKEYAVELRVTDAAFATLIQKYCGIDVVDAISKSEDK